VCQETGKISVIEGTSHNFCQMMEVVKTLSIMNWHSLQELDRRFCIIPVQWSVVTHMKQ